MAAFATLTPIAPKPIIPNFLPSSSGPTNWLFPFSITFPTFSSPFKVLTQSIPSTTLRDDNNKPHNTNSLTAFAFAPGVLNTTIPSSLHLSKGILLTPAPARAIALRFGFIVYSCIDAERTNTPSSSSASSTTWYWSFNKSSPILEILFNCFILYIVISYLFSSSNFFINSNNVWTPSRGIAL